MKFIRLMACVVLSSTICSANDLRESARNDNAQLNVPSKIIQVYKNDRYTENKDEEENKTEASSKVLVKATSLKVNSASFSQSMELGTMVTVTGFDTWVDADAFEMGTAFINHQNAGPYANNNEVEKQSFQASASTNSVKLTWKGNPESTSTYYVLERSKDLNNWKQISRTWPDELNKVKVKHTAFDMDPLLGDAHYRLLQIESDGSVSSIQNIKVKYDGQDLNFMIKPKQDRENAQFKISTDSDIENLRVINSLGMSCPIEVSTVTHENIIDLSNLDKGLYTLMFEANDQIYTENIAIK